MFKTNEYFEGKVKSIGFQAETNNATIGVMAKGEYEFGTSTVEYMTVTSSEMQVLLPGEDEWQTFKAGETFVVEANVKFKAKVDGDTSYLCIYK